jgi:hypothetical protein
LIQRQRFLKATSF